MSCFWPIVTPEPREIVCIKKKKRGNLNSLLIPRIRLSHCLPSKDKQCRSPRVCILIEHQIHTNGHQPLPYRVDRYELARFDTPRIRC